jgi:hypothetical protein
MTYWPLGSPVGWSTMASESRSSHGARIVVATVGTSNPRLRTISSRAAFRFFMIIQPRT